MQFLPARSHLSGSCQGEPQCSRVQTGLQQHTLSCTGYEASAACSRQSERQQGGRQLRQQACHSIQTVAPMQNTAQGKSADRRCQPAPPVHYTDASILFTSAEPPRSAPNMQAKASMLVVGLANSGKTSIVQALKAERSLDDTVPTVGFSVERFHMLNTMLTVVDMSGQPKYQKLWECYYDDVQGVILVIDAADQAQLSDAKGIVQRLQAHTDLEDTPLLIFANKMDLAHALHVSDIAAALDLTEQPERQWQIAASSALTGEGLEEGMRWLLGHIATQTKKSRLRKQSMKQLKVDSPTTRPQQQQQVAAAY